MPRVDNIEKGDRWYKGDDRTLRYTIFQGNTGSGATTPEDITGFAFEWTLKERPESTTALITKTTGAGDITIPVGTDGIALIAIQDTDTDAIDSGNYYKALKRTDPGDELTVSSGRALLQDAASS